MAGRREPRHDPRPRVSLQLDPSDPVRTIILTLSWAGPGDEWRFPAPTTRGSAGAPACAALTCPSFTIDDYSIYSGYAEAFINETDLTCLDIEMRLISMEQNQGRGAVPPRHEELWRTQAATVLTELLTRENYELLRRADAYRALKAARRKHAELAASLLRTEDRQHHYEIRTAILALDDPGHRDIGLRLAPGWHGTADELPTVIAATTSPTRDQPTRPTT